MAKKKVTKKKRTAKNTRNAQKRATMSSSNDNYKKAKKRRRKKSKKKIKVKNPYNKKLANKNQGSWNGIKFMVTPKKVNPVTAFTLQKGIDIDEESSNISYSPASIELTIVLIPELGNDILYQYRAWCSRLKKTDYLFLNAKRIWLKPLMLKNVTVGAKVIDDLGRLRSVELTIEFEEWIASERAKVHAKWKKEQESKSKKKKKKIAKGSWIKIKATKYYGGKKKISDYIRKKKWKVSKISGNKVYLDGLKYPVLKSKCSLIGSTSVSGSGTGSRIANAALSKKGSNYVWGASGPSTFDCSGLVWWSHRHCGIKFGRTDTKGLSKMGKRVSSLSSAKPGDVLIFSSNGSYSGIHHTGIYIGGGKMVHAPHSGAKVHTSVVTSGYYKKQLYTIRRLY